MVSMAYGTIITERKKVRPRNSSLSSRAKARPMINSAGTEITVKITVRTVVFQTSVLKAGSVKISAQLCSQTQGGLGETPRFSRLKLSHSEYSSGQMKTRPTITSV